MTTTLWRAPARISVSGPAGWAPTERIEVHHRDGDALVAVESWAVGDGADLDELAQAHVARRTRGTVSEGRLVTAPVLGRPGGRSCTASWTGGDGRAVHATLGYTLLRGRLFAVTQVAPEGDPEKAAEMASILASVSFTTPVEVDEEALPLRPGAGTDLGPVTAAWLRGAPTVDVTEHVLTTEECSGAARHYGVAMLPGADSSQWNQLDDSQRELASAVAWRSLVARGAQDDPALREALEIAAGHDFLVVVTERSGSESETRWYAARADRMVRVRKGEIPGTLRLGCFDTAALADLVLAGGVDPEAETTAFCVHRRDGRVVGHETTWRGDVPDADARSALAGLLPATAPHEEA